jgi:hypothetical protein
MTKLSGKFSFGKSGEGEFEAFYDSSLNIEGNVVSEVIQFNCLKLSFVDFIHTVQF